MIVQSPCLQAKVVPFLFVKGLVLSSDSEAAGKEVLRVNDDLGRKRFPLCYYINFLTELCDQINHCDRFLLSDVTELSFQEELLNWL